MAHQRPVIVRGAEAGEVQVGSVTQRPQHGGGGRGAHACCRRGARGQGLLMPHWRGQPGASHSSSIGADGGSSGRGLCKRTEQRVGSGRGEGWEVGQHRRSGIGGERGGGVRLLLQQRQENGRGPGEDLKGNGGIRR